MPGHSMGTLWLRVASCPGPAQLLAACSTEMKKQLGGSGDAPQENFGIFELSNLIWGYFRPYCHLELEHFGHAFATNLCAQCKVIVVLYTTNTHTLISGEDTDVILKIQIAILRSSISTPLSTFSTQFAIDNGRFSTNNFQECLHWWGTASSF